MRLAASLTNRIFLASALLVLAAIGVAIVRVNAAVTARAELELQSGLDDAVALLDEFTRTQAADFVIRGSLMADLPVLKAATATGHAPTVQPVAEDHQARMAADLFVVLGRDGTVLANAGRVRLDAVSLPEPLTGCLEVCEAFVPYPGGVLHAASLPIEPGAGPLGRLLVGFSLDQEVARRMGTLTRSEIAFVTPAGIVASTLDRRFDAVLVEASRREGVFSARLDGEEFVGQVFRLRPQTNGDGPLALVLHSRSEQLRFLPGLRWQIALTGLVAILLATGVGYAIARTVTRPLRALTDTMQDIAQTGDLTRSVPAAGRWDDEDARRLAASFGRLTGALARFQAEAAQRERLSALGRLSATIAHEIRNPLMIITSSVRSLRRKGSADAAPIADSISEEVKRINTVVTGVLDFARPARLTLGPADLAELCRRAARAAGPAGAFSLDLPNDAPLVTDADRLHGVIVNLLTNALAAVQARTGQVPTRPVVLRVTPLAPDGWRLEVIDHGVGIPAEDLPRVFDPFFTTRGSGSGLGLALARNIIEGLGGTITLDSRPGRGTTARVDLPDATGLGGSDR